MDLDALLQEFKSEVKEALTGAALLKAVKAAGEGTSKEELLERCGYVSTNAKGKKTLKANEFYQALIAAQGLKLPSSTKGATRTLSYKTTCQTNNQVVLGAAYLKAKGYKPTDKFKVEIKEGSIKLTPVKGGKK